jgi:hypothetical protein
MSLLAYIRDNLAGAWLLMRGRAEGLARLDLSLDGFWRSFAVILGVAPLVLLALTSQQALLPADPDTVVPAADVTRDLLGIVVDWFAFPVVFAVLARPLGLGARYVPFIVARNWATLIVAALLGVIHAVNLVGLLPQQAASILLVLALAVSLRFSYLIARIALAVPPLFALPIVILDVLVSLLVWGLFDRLA